MQRLPTQAAWSCAQQQHLLLLQQQREWQQQQQQQQRQQELEVADKTKRIEELEKVAPSAVVIFAVAFSASGAPADVALRFPSLLPTTASLCAMFHTKQLPLIRLEGVAFMVCSLGISIRQSRAGSSRTEETRRH